MALPNKSIITSSKKGLLPIPTNKTAKPALILPGLTNSSLLSIGQLCDDNCTAIFDKNTMYIYKYAKIILTGNRNINDGLLDVQIPSQTNQNTNQPLAFPNLQANAIIQKKLSKQYLADYLHACAFSSTLPTFNEAIKNGQFLSWPSIEKINFNKFLSDQTATHLGHMDQERSNLQSTKLQQHIKDDFFHSKKILTQNNSPCVPNWYHFHQKNSRMEI